MVQRFLRNTGPDSRKNGPWTNGSQDKFVRVLDTYPFVRIPFALGFICLGPDFLINAGKRWKYIITYIHITNCSYYKYG